MPMLQRDLQLCREALDSLMAEENRFKNYLFLEPVNLQHVPDYLAVVSNPMDLGTIRQRLLQNNNNHNYYSKISDFWRDVQLVFDNAILFHKDRKDTNFIVKLAKEMIKLTNREKKKLVKKKAELDNHNNNNNHASTKSNPTTTTTTAAATTTTTKKKNPTLRLKLSTKSPTAAATPSSSSSSSTKTSGNSNSNSKARLKLKPSSSTPTAAGGGNSSTPKTSNDSSSSSLSKPKKKTTLKLSLNKSKSPPPPSTTTSTPSAAASSSSSSSSSSNAKIRITPPSRGKELPKGITQPTTTKSTASTTAATPNTTTTTSSSSTSTTKATSGASSTKSKKSTKSSTKSSASSTKSKKSTSSKSKKQRTTPTNAATIAAAKLQQQQQAASSSSSSSTAALVGGGTSNKFDLVRQSQCMKILSGLKRRQSKNVGWFLHPVSEKNFDKVLCADYKAKISHPMDLGTMFQKVERLQYHTVREFCLDLRRIFGNCLRFNTTKQDPVRPVALQMLLTAEQLMAHFLRDFVQPPLLYCWRLCLGILDALLNVTNPTNGHQTAHFFLHPASYFFGGTFPSDYRAKIRKPMDLGTVTSNLVEGVYQSVADFNHDCRLVIANCLEYYSDRADGSEFTQQATHLRELMSQQLDALVRYDQSPNAVQARAAAVSYSTVRLPKPPQALLLSILTELRGVQYTDRLTKLSEPAMRHFEKPVNRTVYKDYLQYVTTPMDLETIETKIKSNRYDTPEDFEHDVHLVFKNCEAYNAPRKTDQLVAIGKYGAKEFRKLFAKRMKAYEQPSTSTSTSTSNNNTTADSKSHSGDKRSSPNNSSGQPTAKRAKAEHGGKQAPQSRVSSSDTTTTTTTKRSKSPKPSSNSSGSNSGGAGGGKRMRNSPHTVPSSNNNNSNNKNQPVPLHVAIAEVKQRFPLRRHLKFLDPWEAACAKFFKELMKHPWISAARPKFIFHVPVPIIFPQLAQAYLQKIKKPMDLTTAEAKLLKGGEYFTPQDFIDDVALVFSNAITFNKAGRDEGDHLSIAYYDASIHLLRYTRWLSLEHLTKFFVTDEDGHVDAMQPNGMPPTGWKLSKANRSKTREEMESIVLNEPIEKSLEGDRTYTWMESECEKLLKALRHQSDLRYMTFFIQANYPDDYTAFISKPMDWEQVQRSLQKRQYNKFAEIIEDLRLIFSNALRYNARHKGTDTVSGRAYDAAVYMSDKLETAIDKLMLTVSDRLERERIEHAMAEREIEAAERAEEERLRAAMKDGDNGNLMNNNNNNNKNANNTATGMSSTTTNTKLTPTMSMSSVGRSMEGARRRPVGRRDMDFEVPFFDEDDGNLEQSHVEMMRQQRATFERQRQERATLHKISVSTGALVLARRIQWEQGTKWAQNMANIANKKKKKTPKEGAKDQADKGGERPTAASGPSSVYATLNSQGRKVISFQTKHTGSKKRKRERPLLSLE